MVLCPVLKAQTGLIAHMVDNTAQRCLLFRSPSPLPQQSEEWGGQEVVKEQTGQLTPTDQRDIPHHLMCSAEITGGKIKKGRNIHLSSQPAIVCAEALIPRKQMEICLLMASTESIPFFLHLHKQFLFFSLE